MCACVCVCVRSSVAFVRASFLMDRHISFTQAGIVFGPRAFAKVREIAGAPAALAALAAVVLGGGYILNRLLFVLPSLTK